MKEPFNEHPHMFYDTPEQVILQWTRVMESLSDNWVGKAVLSLATAISGLFATPEHLVGLITLLVGIDFVAGIAGAWARKEQIRAKVMWNTGVKVVQYIMFLMATTMVSNSFGVLSMLQEASYLFVALTELKSIIENVFGKKGRGKEVWDYLKNIMNRDVP